MNEDEKLGLKKRPKIDVGIDPEDDEPIGSIFKLKKPRNPKRGTDGSSGNGNANKVETRAKKTVLDDQDFGNMNDTLASFRKKLRGPKKDSGSGIMMGHHSVLNASEPSAHFPIDSPNCGDFDVKSSSEKVFKGPVIGDDGSDAMMVEQSKYRSKGRYRKSKAASLPKENIDSAKIDVVQDYLESRFTLSQNQRAGGESSDHCSDETLEDSLSAFVRKAQSGLIRKTSSSSKPRKGLTSENGLISAGVSDDSKLARVRKSLSSCGLKQVYELPKPANNLHSVCGIIPVDVAPNQSVVLENEMSVDGFCEVSECTRDKLLSADQFDGASLVPLVKDDRCFRSSEAILKDSVAPTLPINSECGSICSKDAEKFIDGKSDRQGKVSQTGLPVEPCVQVEGNGSAPISRITLETRSLKDGLAPCSMGIASSTGHDFVETPSSPKQVEEDKGEFFRTNDNTIRQQSKNGLTAPNIMEQNLCFTLRNEINVLCNSPCGSAYEDSCKQSSEKNFGEHLRFQSQNLPAVDSPKKEETCSSCDGLNQFRDTNKEERHLASPAMLFHADHESDFSGDIIQLKKSLRTEDNLNKLSQEIDSDEFTTSVLKCSSDFPQNQSYEGASKGIIGPANDYNSMNEEANEVSSLSVTPDRNQGYLEDAGSVPEPEIKNNKIPVVQRAVRRAKKRRHGDMAYEGDSDWEHEQGFLESHQFIGHDQSSKMRDKSDSLSTDAEAESGGLAAVAAGLKARAAGPVEKIKFKEILKRRGGLQEYLECRNRILGLWSQDVSHILLLTDCGVSDTPSENEIPHDSLIREVYKFLDHRGYINVGIASKRKKGEPNGTHNYKLLRERSFAKNSGIPGVDSDDGVFFILGREKGYEACKEAKNGVVFDEVNQTSEPTKGEVLVALKTSELSSLTEPEEGSADDSQENGSVDAKLPTTENGYVDAKVATTTSNLDALNLDPSSEVPDSEIIPGRAPDFKNCFHSVQCSSTDHIEQNYDMQQSPDARKRIIVIGAGPAGLTAARHLQRQGFSVDVLEARSRIGGRVFTDHSSLSVPVDLGASIITGVEADVATERRPDPSSLICAQLGLELTVLNSDCPLYDILTGEKVPSVLDETLEAEYNSLLDDMVLLVAHEGEHSMRMSLEDGLEYALKKRRLSRSGANYEGTELHISEDNSVATKKIVDGQIVERNKHEEEILSPLERRVMDWHFANLEYGCAALLQEVSLPYWNQDDIYGGFGGAHCMIKGGYSSVVESIGEGLHIHLNHVVTNVSYGTKETGMTGDQCSKVRVSTSNGNEFSGDAVLITVPLGCLKAETIKFSPPLPQWKNSSIQRLGFGVLNKVALEFPEVFWDDSVDYFGATAEETRLRGQCFMFWNVKKTVGAPVLIALVVGKAAIEGQYMNMADHVKHAVMVLRKLFGEGSVPDPVASVVTDWGKDPFSYGAYSYVAVGASGEDYDMLGRPVENCLFFAGEATCKEHPDTVGGAMISGLREAVRMIDILNTGNDYVAEVEAMEATQKHSDSERNEVRDIVKRLDAVELSNVLYNPPVDRSQILSRKKLLQDMFCTAKTTAGRLHLAKELLKLPVEALKSFAGTKKGLGILNSWILDSMGKDGTQLLRHCVRILVLVSSDLLAVRLSGVGKTVKEKVCVHTSRDIRAIASQLVSMWIEVFRKEKASNGGRKFLKQAAAADSSKSRSAKELASGKPPLRMHHVAPENQASLQVSASARSHSPSKSNCKKVDAKPIKLENMADTKSEIHSSTQGSAGGMDLEGEVDRRTNMSDEEKVAFAAAEAARATARAAAEAYASSEAKCSTSLQLPKIPSFHKFARREQYAQMDEFDFKRKWAGGILGRQDCLSEIDSRNCRVRNWSVDFSAACVNLDSSRVSVDNLSQRSHSNELACQFGLREHSGESMAADSSMFTKAWVDTAGSVKDYHAVERWQSQAAAADLLHSTTHIRDEEDSNTISRQPSLNLDQIANEGSFTRLTINKDLTGNQTRGAERIKQAVVDYVASLLMPLYKAKKIDKEGYKSIMKKTATKVMEQTTDAEKGMSVLEFLDFKRKNKIRSFVDKLIERHMVKPVVEH